MNWSKRTEPNFQPNYEVSNAPDDPDASSRVRSLLGRDERDVKPNVNRGLGGGIISILIICAVGYWLWSAMTPHFSDAELASMKSSIKSEFEKRDGITVTEVVMLRETSTKATGFVKLDAPILGEVTRSCSATMGDDWRYVWQCQ